MMERLVTCPGCKLTLPDSNLALHDHYLAAGECRLIYDELAAYNISRSDPYFIHQFAVDAYGAQHTGSATRPITTAFALVGLYLAAKHSFTGRQVQLAHMELAPTGRVLSRLPGRAH